MKTLTLYDNANSSFSIEATDGKLEISAEGLEVTDGYHTMHELYQHRMALNIALFHDWYQTSKTIRVFKSKQHSDGSMFDGYFIVMALTPAGQISYHYKLEHWEEFVIPVVDKCPEYDGHGSLEVMERLKKV